MNIEPHYEKIKAVFSEENHVPQPPSKDGDLENQGRVIRIISTLYCISKKQYIKFGQNPSFSPKDSKGKHNFGQNLKFLSAGVTLKIK